MSAFCGFGFTIAAAKRQHPSGFTQGFEGGSALAARALGWGTIYAIGGVGALTFIVWKLLGKQNFQREKPHFDILSIFIYQM